MRGPASSVGALLLLWAAPLGCGGESNPTADEPETCLDRAVFGDPSDSPYLLPYPVGARYPVLQGYCSNGSHRNRFPYDFLMGFGDTVTAARGGEVRVVVESWTDDDKEGSHNNYLFMIHDDGSVALYAHFRHEGISVREGDRVVTGQPLGAIGESGTPTPCAFLECGILHFGVYASWPPTDENEVPVNFRNADGALDARGGLRAGGVYAALEY